MILYVYTDGGARGNPGPAGFGVAIFNENHQSLYQTAKFLGIKTNNEAEYMGIIAAADWLVKNSSRLSVSKIIFHSDSQLLIRQLQGSYKVKAVHLKPLHAAVTTLLLSLSVPYHFEHIPRENNELTDGLANQAMDQKL